jgi:nitrogen fixation NifU-like protein
MDLRDLYQDVIVDHNRSPRNFRKLADATRTQEGFNPLCGDKLMLYLKLDGDRIRDVSFEGSGCAISVASASLMSQTIKGKTIQEAEQLFSQMHALLIGDGHTLDLESLGSLAALSGVSEYPSRVKCASLCWHTLKAALKQTNQVAQPAEVSTE